MSRDTMTAREVQEVTGLPPSTLYRRIRRGTFPAPFPIPGSARDTAFVRADVERWVAEHGVRAPIPRKPGVSVYRTARRFKRETEADAIAACLRALNPSLEQDETGHLRVVVATAKPVAFERFVRHATPFEQWERDGADSSAQP